MTTVQRDPPDATAEAAALPKPFMPPRSTARASMRASKSRPRTSPRRSPFVVTIAAHAGQRSAANSAGAPRAHRIERRQIHQPGLPITRSASNRPANGPIVSPAAPRPLPTASPSIPRTHPSNGRISAPTGRKPTRVSIIVAAPETGRDPQRLGQHLRLAGGCHPVIEAGAGLPRGAGDDAAAVERHDVMAAGRQDDRPVLRLHALQPQMHDLAALRFDRQADAERPQHAIDPGAGGDDHPVGRDALAPDIHADDPVRFDSHAAWPWITVRREPPAAAPPPDAGRRPERRRIQGRRQAPAAAVETSPAPLARTGA